MAIGDVEDYLGELIVPMHFIERKDEVHVFIQGIL